MSQLVANKACKVCKAVKANKALRTRIDKCRFYVPSSRDLPTHISRNHEGEFSHASLLNHMKKHQIPNAGEIKRAEEAAVSRKRQASYGDIWDTVIEKGQEALESGTLQINNVNQVLLAARDKSNFEKSSRDQSLALMDMVYRFSSQEIALPNAQNRQVYEGEASPGVDAEQPSGDTHKEPLGPRDFYQSLAGDTPPRRSGEVPTGNDSPKD